ncbi:glycosyltransferase family 4 protein [Marinobacter pelagius]|uniref:glycosyltransferase family 4 protein n=1 Tax=Marinobacter sp. C7 TaxID=2951363 RepID=UPI001EF0C45D|nr:glycosyltransferase family 4 protein [Marinobacter sp. C7]MCG7199473.1 glycosyltransferase family 4 protein [Marinobacter sp. C7]
MKVQVMADAEQWESLVPTELDHTPSILVLFHCESNPGFAASSHEHTFLRAALNLAGNYSKVHFAYRDLSRGMTPSLPQELVNIIQIDNSWNTPGRLLPIQRYIEQNRISIVFGFDQPVRRPLYRYLRKGGVTTFVSYWGAPMSSLNKGFKLLLKRVDARLSPWGPDHYIFQSEGMRKTAVHGRGIPIAKTSIVRTGIDTDVFFRNPNQRFYCHESFNIPKDRKIVFFSGHMEPRKGVGVLVRTAMHLIDQGYQKAHFVILGNRHGQEQPYLELLGEHPARNHVTFGGYRSDIPSLLSGCSLGLIASTGWDSFPMSSLEMSAAELPLLVSDLPGLRETVHDGAGVTFEPGNIDECARKIRQLLDDPDTAAVIGKKGRERVLKGYSRVQQVEAIESIIRTHARLKRPET